MPARLMKSLCRADRATSSPPGECTQLGSRVEAATDHIVKIVGAWVPNAVKTASPKTTE
jgi:hypothetical protein